MNADSVLRLMPAVVLVMGTVAVPQPASAQTPAAGRPPTFTRDVAPIFQEKCEACHRPGNIGPMSLVTFEEVRPWVRSIKTRVASREMPPWHLDKGIGIQKFINDRSLSDAADRHHRPVDRRRRAARRHEGHAAAEAVAGRRSVLPRGRCWVLQTS